MITKTTVIKTLPIFIIWAIGLFLRCYRQSALLPFYYDQGRDAKMAMDIVALKNFPAIGPTTGINGLYLGPFWFYLITPGYFFGQGNPVIASYFITFLESLTIPLIFYLLKTYWRTNTAYVASFIWAFSHYLIRSSRWFSNPSPLPFFVLLLMIFLIKVFKDKKYYLLPWIALILGLSLQLEAASAIFFFPTILIFFILNFSQIKKIKFLIWLKSVLAFLVLLLPQLAFEIKNNFLISKNFIAFLTGRVNSDTGKSWAIPTINFLETRLIAYYQNFFSKLDTNVTQFSLLFLIIFLVGILFLVWKHRNNILIRLQLLWLFIPLLLLLFFVGNYGNLYDYYLTGFFPAFIILFSIIISLPKKLFFYLLLIIPTVIYFFKGTYIPLRNYLSAGIDGPETVVYGNEIQAVDFACKMNSETPGNYDVYVPPVIAHAYEYLFQWRQSKGLCPQFIEERNSNLYIVYEVDPPHPERLQNWFDKYKQDELIHEEFFGGVRVQQILRKQ
ncbi:glycosyltransferase family 39 protein [Patescibacteria group bacterium]|nr:glycosyltransferase family 39 protein [Patescibacteria group bacterium]